MDIKEWFDGLDEDLKAKVKDCRSVDDLKALLEDSGTELSEDVLSGLSAGYGEYDPWTNCPSNCPLVFF